MTNAIVAIVGRTNVGKSTLLNRLAGQRKAVVADSDGITRDRVLASISWQGQELTLIDTGGWQSKPASTLEEKVQKQVEIAIAEADVIIMMMDARDGVIASDEEVIDALRNSNKPVVLAVNKVDSTNQSFHIGDFLRLGIGTPIAISAYHNLGITDLMEAVIPLLPTPTVSPEKSTETKLAIVGRPNVGKSTLLNTLLGTERVIVHNAPGTTRDAIDVAINWDNKKIVLIDTAGIKRQGKISSSVDFYSFIRAIQAINRGDVALLVIDAADFITVHDMHIANYIKEAWKSMVLIVNKWDLIPSEKRQQFKLYLEERTRFMSYVPILYISAQLKLNTGKILPTAYKVWQERHKIISNSDVDTVINKAFEKYPPQLVGLKQLHIFHAHQDNNKPTTFVLEVNNPQLAYTSYRRYLEKQLRGNFPFSGSPLHLSFIRAGNKNKRIIKAAKA
jgi:GTP-binding protein